MPRTPPNAEIHLPAPVQPAMDTPAALNPWKDQPTRKLMDEATERVIKVWAAAVECVDDLFGEL